MSSPTYSNPAWDGYCADPFVLRHEGVYYAYGTHYVPGPDGGMIPGRIEGLHFVVLRSTDLENWECIGGALDPLPGCEERDHWAPEVAATNGKFWMYYSTVPSAQNDWLQKLRVAAADRPEGPFRDVGVALCPEEQFSIDASPFCDPRDGRWYLFFSKDFLEGRVGTGTAVVPLSDDMVTPLEPSRPVVVASADWQISARNRTVYGRHYDLWHTVEGAHVIYREGRYYCFYSGGDWAGENYGVGYAVADHPLGPWQDMSGPIGPIVLRSVPGKLIGPGHNSVTLAPDNSTFICVYHAWNEARTKRQICLSPIAWTDNGPVVQIAQ